MKRILFTLLSCVTAPIFSFAQNAAATDKKAVDSVTVMAAVADVALPLEGTTETAVLENGVAMVVYTSVQQHAEFNGDVVAWLQKNIAYPSGAQKDKVEGRAIVRFIVDKDGTVLNPQIMRTTGNAELDAEATRVVRSMPAWKPGMQYGKAVPTFFHLPISFELK